MAPADNRGLKRQTSLWDKVQENFPVDLDLNARGADGATPQQPEDEADVLSEAAASPQAHHGDAAASGATKPLAAPLLRRLMHRQLSPQQVMLRDKVGFVAGIANIAITAWWMGQWPQTFYLWYTAKSLLLYGLRFLIYRSKGQHYFLLELCYSVNVLLLTYLWVFPRSAWLYKAVFGLVAGPLTWSIVALRNSLVLHSLDQMTSLFMHASPALVVWALRWTRAPSVINVASLAPAEAAKFSYATFAELVGCTMTMYSVWAVLYYLKVFVISASKIREENYETLYSLMTKNKNGMVAKIVFSVPKPFQPVVYMLFHLLLSAAAAATSYLCWHSFYYHTTFILLMLLGAAWNGSSFYFQHFAFKYVQKTGLDRPPDKKVP